jgi:hypothetical protein
LLQPLDVRQRIVEPTQVLQRKAGTGRDRGIPGGKRLRSRKNRERLIVTGQFETQVTEAQTMRRISRLQLSQTTKAVQGILRSAQLLIRQAQTQVRFDVRGVLFDKLAITECGRREIAAVEVDICKTQQRRRLIRAEV